MSRRATRASLATRRTSGRAVEVEERLKIIRLADGRFLLVTERIVTEQELRSLGIAPPAEDVPWVQKAEDPTAHLQKRTPAPQKMRHPVDVAMDHWRKNLGGFDPRLPGLVPSAIHEFGLDRLLRAFDEVKGLRGRERYSGLKALLNRWRGEGAR